MVHYVYIVLSIILIAFFIFLVLKIVDFFESLKDTLITLEKNLTSTIKNANNTISQLEPVISNLSRVEEDILVTLSEIRNTTNKFEQIFIEISSLLNTYKKLGEGVDKLINTQFKDIVSDVAATTSKVNSLAKDVSLRVENSLLTLDEVYLLSKRFTSTTKVLVDSLQDLTIELTSTTHGIKKAIEYLRDNLLFKGGK